MKKFLVLVLLLTGVSCMNKSKNTAPKAPLAPPIAAKKPHKMEKHGDVRNDEYFWLRERENPEVISYLNAENSYVEQELKPIESLRETLFQEMKSRIKEDDQSAPFFRKGYWYYTRMEAGKQYPIHARRAGDMNSPEEVLLNVNQMAVGHDFTQCSSPAMSPNQQIMLYGCDFKGRRFYDLKARDLSSGKDLAVDIKDVTGDVVWAEDGRHFFYTKQHPETLRSQWVYRYDMQTGENKLVYEEKDETFSVWLDKSLARKHIFINNFSTLSTETLYIPADRPLEAFKPLLPREKDHRYSVVDGGDRFYINTNWKAKNFRLMEAPYSDTSKKAWKDVIPHRKDVYLSEMQVFKDFLALIEREQGQDRLVLMSRGPKKERFVVAEKDQSYLVSLGANANFDQNFVRYEYESPRQPTSTIDIDFNTHAKVLAKIKDVPGFNPDRYRNERIWVTARDGVKVPITLLMKKEIKTDGKNPMLVYGYGSYGSGMSPWFSSTVFSLVDRGWVYAVAHIRGGNEMGELWYENGRTQKKMNTFNDFIDSTEGLVKLGYADPKRVYAQGGSAGGLLMGAVMNMRPGLYNGMIAEVPFVDVITTMLDDSIPLTTGEYDEWGNPNVKKDYQYIRKYSPYDNVVAKNYPHLLVTTGLHDSQVQYWEPAKWVAKLREVKTDKNLLLLKTDMSSGHGGASGRYNALKDEAWNQGFLLFIDSGKKAR